MAHYSSYTEEGNPPIEVFTLGETLQRVAKALSEGIAGILVITTDDEGRSTPDREYSVLEGDYRSCSRVPQPLEEVIAELQGLLQHIPPLGDCERPLIMYQAIYSKGGTETPSE